jgi:hypothetical protein
VKTRRRFIAEASTTLAALSFVPGAVAELSSRTRQGGSRARASLDQLTFTTFDRLVDTAFVVRAPTGLRTVLLAAAEKLPSPTDDHSGSGDSFSLTFRHGTGALLTQDTYTFYHSRIGEFEMFMVPVARAVGGQQYEAVFNRL